MRFRLLALLALAVYLPLGTGAAGAWHVWFDHHHDGDHAHDRPAPLDDSAPSRDDSEECPTCFHLLTVTKCAFDSSTVVQTQPDVVGHLIAAAADFPVRAACPISGAPRAPPSLV